MRWSNEDTKDTAEKARKLLTMYENFDPKSSTKRLYTGKKEGLVRAKIGNVLRYTIKKPKKSKNYW